ncbi:MULTISPECIES: succinate--CoA ligase subunit beta [Candidatus Nitrosocaldus]|jgi:succinyl-CoA synthetase beta subunit|uniref:Succinyl-CoA ligase (ADP-forming) beta subunit n=1 Tax=Candidatus Nitrosocaldus cavascurensis TaxID=2058097 RepID=A0A2K5AQJ1_9ARCH|nr:MULTISPECIES: ATP-grasp domain-containing protein [Candidatus Nitrosocaldus]SPC33922.1 succinyl-CoA ligase (ADP-forming) beta subunit [Candidatus Nitrosocaldus cavascurensis]
MVYVRLLEYQAKMLFKDYGIPVPRGYLATNLEEARQYARELGFPLVLKAQVRVGGRGKAGVVKICRDPNSFDDVFKEMMGKSVQGEVVKSILLEEFMPHNKELYLSIFLDRSKRSYAIIASPEGGVEIESVSNKVVHTLDIDDSNNNSSLLHDIAAYMGFNEDGNALVDIASRLIKLVDEKEAELAEINPMAVRDDGSIIALDAKVIVDDNALFRHEELRVFEEQSIEVEARRSGFSLVELDGNIAVVGNGAGLVMSTIDMLSDADGRAACFLDVGGSATLENIYKALTLVSRLSSVKAILVNLYGGIVDTSIVAKAIVSAYKDNIIQVPVFARIAGRNADIARDMLKGTKAVMFESVEEAIDNAVRAVKDVNNNNARNR